MIDMSGLAFLSLDADGLSLEGLDFSEEVVYNTSQRRDAATMIFARACRMIMHEEQPYEDARLDAAARIFVAVVDGYVGDYVKEYEFDDTETYNDQTHP